MRGDAVKIISLEKVLCVVMLSIVVAPNISRAEEPASGGTAGESFFAYRSSCRARLLDSLFWGSGAVPFDVPVELTPVDPSAWAHATINSPVTFRVVHDVIVRHDTYARAGELVEAKVTQVREGELRYRRGRMEPRVMEVTLTGEIDSSLPTSLKLRLESSPRSRCSRTAKQLATLPLKVVHVAGAVVVFPVEWVLLVIFCHSGCDL